MLRQRHTTTTTTMKNHNNNNNPYSSNSTTSTTTSSSKSNNISNTSNMMATNTTNSNSSSITIISIVHLYNIIWCLHLYMPIFDTILYQNSNTILGYFMNTSTTSTSTSISSDTNNDTKELSIQFMIAVDHRPLTIYDYTILIPLTTYILVLYIYYYYYYYTIKKKKNDTYNDNNYQNTTLYHHHNNIMKYMILVHSIDIIIRWIRMPYVWDHEQWATICNCMYIACFIYPTLLLHTTSTITTSSSKNTITNYNQYIYYWLSQSCIVFGILYMAATFWKYTTSFWNRTTSCGSSLVLETIITYYLPNTKVIPYEIQQFATYFGPYLTVLVEGYLGWTLIYLGITMNHNNSSTNNKTTKNASYRIIIRNITVIIASIFHLTIYILPVNAAGGFSLDCMTRLIFFFHPNEIYNLLYTNYNKYMNVTRGRIWMIMAILWTRYKGTMYLPDFGLLYFCLIFDLYIMIMFTKITTISSNNTTNSTATSNDTVSSSSSKSKPNHTKVSSITKILSNGMIFFSILYGFGLTILGLEQMGAPTMYSNLRSYYGGNHMFVPTGILGDDLLYGGRLVQILYSTCDPLNQMLGYINATDLVPEPLYTYQKAWLRNTTIPKTPIYADTIPMQFLPLCIGNPHSNMLLKDYYRRSNPIGQPAPFQFILPMNAVQRAVQKANTLQESFIIKVADGGKSSLLKEPPNLIDGITEVIVINEKGECTIEYYNSNNNTNQNDDGNDETSAITIKACPDDHILAKQLLFNDNDNNNNKSFISIFMKYLVDKLLIPYPQIMNEPEEVCMS